MIMQVDDTGGKVVPSRNPGLAIVVLVSSQAMNSLPPDNLSAAVLNSISEEMFDVKKFNVHVYKGDIDGVAIRQQLQSLAYKSPAFTAIVDSKEKAEAIMALCNSNGVRFRAVQVVWG
jgi:hypothetical protein